MAPLRWAPSAVLVAWLGLQFLLPLRGLVIGDQPRWDGVGYRFAWNVVATDKTGSLVFEVDRVGAGLKWLTRAPGLPRPSSGWPPPSLILSCSWLN